MLGDRQQQVSQTTSSNTTTKNLKENNSPTSINTYLEEPTLGIEVKSSNNDSNRNEPIKSENNTTNSKEKKKKKSSWFTSFYPTYKSRSEDFKRIFKEVPDDERLLVDYSCAVQKEILVHGRLYSTQNFLCFYANIFGWETNIVLKWKDVTAITKEKTAIVIPNAVLISTKSDKYFFTSFVARDKVYLMLFRVWQNALMDQQMGHQEMWQWVHQSYGAELGLTSDDEDYIAPGTEEGKLTPKKSTGILLELDKNIGTSSSESSNNKSKLKISDENNENDLRHFNRKLNKMNSEAQGSSDLSDTDFSDLDIPQKYDMTNINCDCSHEGRQLLNELLPIHVDQLFTLLFTNSKFYLDFHAARKTTNIVQTPWTQNTTDDSKTRIVNLTVALSQPIGPKCSQVIETQTMLPCSKPGILYAINSESTSGGVPYADSFYIDVHTCIKKVSENQSSLVIFAQVKFKKSIWGLVKSMIEKNCWSGLEDFYTSLSKTLQTECEEYIPEVKKKIRKRRKFSDFPKNTAPIVTSVPELKEKEKSHDFFKSNKISFLIIFVLIFLVVLNLLLYYKLWILKEDNLSNNLLNVQLLKNPPTNQDEWLNLFKKQDNLHRENIKKWQDSLKLAISYLKQAENILLTLQQSTNFEDVNENNAQNAPSVSSEL